MSSDQPASSLYNEDLAPVPAEKRTWSMWHIASLWVGMAVCIPTYTLAASLISGGMNWKQALFTITLGNVIVLIPMILNAHAGTKYGVPFPVLVRASFGVYGANVPALLRGFVACGWFGIQTWIGGAAIYTLLSVMFGFELATDADRLPVLGLSAGEFGCFMIFWIINIGIFITGTEGMKLFEALSAPFLILIGLALLAWAVTEAGGFAVVLSEDTVQKVRGAATGDFNFWKVFWPSLTAMVGFWATLSLNIPDFTRFAKSQRDQVLGQAIGLPPTMAIYAFIGIAVTCATVLIYGEAIWDPVALIGKFKSKIVVAVALFGLSLATLTTNIAANVVSPANDISNLSPSKISFKMGGIITGIVGILIMPWKLYSDLSAYIFTWLIGYGSLLGAIGGVMIADYFILRGANLNERALYDPNGEYSYGSSGFNWRALVALAVGIAPNVPGFLQAATSTPDNPGIQVPQFWNDLYTYSWFVGFVIAGLVHVVLTMVFPAAEPAKTQSSTESAPVR